MKLRSTTPKLLPFSRWLVVFMLLSSLMIVLALSAPSRADDDRMRQAKIKQLTEEIDKKISSARMLNTQSDTIQSQIEALKKERDYLYAQLLQTSTSQLEIEQSIAKTESVLEQKKEALGTIMANLYIDDSISPLEVLASSRSFADYIDGQAMRESMQQQFTKSIADMKQTRTELDRKKQALARLIGAQKNQQLALSQRQAEQAILLSATQSQSGELTKVTEAMAGERKKLQEQQQSSMAAQMSGAEQVLGGTISKPINTETVQSAQAPASSQANQPASPPTASDSPPSTAPISIVLPNGGYPESLQNCFVDTNALSYGIDPWGYGCRQCVSYTAWKVLQKTGKPAMYWGNAKQWPASARNVGYQTGITPRAESVAVMTSGPYGHVAWVESINQNGTLNISQCNYWLPGKSNGGWGWYSEFRNVKPSTYQAYIYL